MLLDSNTRASSMACSASTTARCSFSVSQSCYRLIVKCLTVLVLAILVPLGCRGSDSGWTLVRSPHFHGYSQLGEHDGQSIALTLEQLRAFFLSSVELGAHVALENDRPVRVRQFAPTSAY